MECVASVPLSEIHAGALSERDNGPAGGGRGWTKAKRAPPYPPSKIKEARPSIPPRVSEPVFSSSVFEFCLRPLELCILPTKNKDRGIK